MTNKELEEKIKHLEIFNDNGCIYSSGVRPLCIFAPEIFEREYKGRY